MLSHFVEMNITTAESHLGRHIHPSREMSMTTPMNCVKRMSGVKKDHTGHSAMLKLEREGQIWNFMEKKV